MKRILVILILLAGCAPPPGATVCMVHGSVQKKYVVDSFVLPKKSTDFAVDLDGDGKKENQLGNIIAVGEYAEAFSQVRVDEAIANGSFRPTVVLTTDSVLNAEGSGVVWSDGGMAGSFCGAVVGGGYASEDGALVELTLKMPFFDNMSLPITAARIRFAILDGRITGGQLNGAVKKAEFDKVALPGIANRLNDKIAAAPMDAASRQLLNLFDGGGDAACMAPKNGIIEPCEIGGNSILKQFLDADVDLFDGKGAYRPNVDKKLDCVSMGVGFTAIEMQ